VVDDQQKWAETAGARRIHGTKGDIRVSSAQPAACAVGAGSIWEMSVRDQLIVLRCKFVLFFEERTLQLLGHLPAGILGCNILRCVLGKSLLAWQR
jgi:hypothetical protein